MSTDFQNEVEQKKTVVRPNHINYAASFGFTYYIVILRLIYPI